VVAARTATTGFVRGGSAAGGNYRKVPRRPQHPPLDTFGKRRSAMDSHVALPRSGGTRRPHDDRLPAMWRFGSLGVDYAGSTRTHHVRTPPGEPVFLGSGEGRALPDLQHVSQRNAS
jgi:hypothetical protein